MPYDVENEYKDIVLVTEEAREYLNPRQEIAYKEHRKELAKWIVHEGKNPLKAEGYSPSTAKNRMNKLAVLNRHKAVEFTVSQPV